MSKLLERHNEYVRPADQWQNNPIENECVACTGPDKKGVCCQQPPQCTPVRNLRSRRGIFVASCTALIIGMVIALASGEDRNEFFAPGPLTSHHAIILTEQGNDRCAACHTEANGTLGDWISAAITAGKHIPIGQSQLCMDCHTKSICDEFALTAHNVDPKELAQITAETLGRQNVSHLIESDQQIACSTCHKEHHGADFNLSMLTDNQCQTCHVKHIHGFEADHPEFKNWPNYDQRNINFDHNTHGLKHFKEAEVEFNCNDCHVPDTESNVLQLAPFSQSCASCHEEKIVNTAGGPQPPSFTIFSLPMIDVQAFVDNGLAVGQWPELATGDFDGPLPPVMQTLLSADENAAEVLKRHGETFDFADLDPDSKTDVEDAHTLVWSIKSLLHDLSTNGNLAIKYRLEKVTNRQVTDAELAGMLNGLDATLFTRAQQRWLPELLSEITNNNHGVAPALSWVPSDRNLLGKSYQDDEDLLAINPIASLIQQQQSSEAPKQETVAEENETSPKIINQTPVQQNDTENALRIENPNIADGVPKTPTETSQQESSPVQGDSQTLAENPLAAILAGDLPETIIQAPGDNAVPGSTNIEPENFTTIPPTNVAETNVEPQVAETTETRPPESQATDVQQSLTQLLTAIANGELGPWSINDTAFSIDYRLSDHADVVMAGWIDWSVPRTGFEPSEALQNVFHSDLAKGNCRSCHSMTVEPLGEVDGRVLSTASINWQANYRDPTIRDFTRFSHRPHLITGDIEECATCHQLSGEHGIELGLSDFTVLAKSQCASCHHRGGAGDSCTSCHNYHVGSKVLGRKQ